MFLPWLAAGLSCVEFDPYMYCMNVLITFMPYKYGARSTQLSSAAGLQTWSLHFLVQRGEFQQTESYVLFLTTTIMLWLCFALTLFFFQFVVSSFFVFQDGTQKEAPAPGIEPATNWAGKDCYCDTYACENCRFDRYCSSSCVTNDPVLHLLVYFSTVFLLYFCF